MKKLYHYTDQNGFLGIFETKELWATKIQYLNDDNEHKLAINIAHTYLDKLQKNSRFEGESEVIKELINSLDNIVNINICVCSLSEKGDLLSQWRGYSNSLGGYSIGFDKDKLEKSLEGSGFELVKCIYDKAQQEKVIHELVNDFLRSFQNDDKLNVREFCYELSRVGQKIKDGHFQEECEWRIASFKALNFNQLEFRPGKSMLIPYKKIKLNKKNIDPITEVIVGHTPNIELAEKSTKAFMYKTYESNNRPKVIVSKIPFRNW